MNVIDEAQSAQTESIAVKNKTWWEKIKKEAEGARDALGVEDAGSDKWNELTQKIAEAEAQLKKYTAAATSDRAARREVKEFGEEQRRPQAIQELQRQIRAAEVQEELDTRQAVIETMEDGTEKELAQIALGYDRRLLEIAKKADELIKKQQEIEQKIRENEHPDWKEKKLVFTPSTTGTDYLTSAQQKQILNMATAANQAMQKANDELLKENDRTMTEYLKQYGSYEEKRLAVTREYAEKIKKAQTEGERLSLAAGRDNELSELEAAFIRQNDLWKKLVTDTESLTVNQARVISRQLREMVLSIADGDVREKLTETLDGIDRRIEDSAEKMKNIFGDGKGGAMINLFVGNDNFEGLCCNGSMLIIINLKDAQKSIVFDKFFVHK